MSPNPNRKFDFGQQTQTLSPTSLGIDKLIEPDSRNHSNIEKFRTNEVSPKNLYFRTQAL